MILHKVFSKMPVRVALHCKCWLLIALPEMVKKWNTEDIFC